MYLSTSSRNSSISNWYMTTIREPLTSHMISRVMQWKRVREDTPIRRGSSCEFGRKACQRVHRGKPMLMKVLEFLILYLAIIAYLIIPTSDHSFTLVLLSDILSILQVMSPDLQLPQ
jgi:hypothetical protein